MAADGPLARDAPSDDVRVADRHPAPADDHADRRYDSHPQILYRSYVYFGFEN